MNRRQFALCMIGSAVLTGPVLAAPASRIEVFKSPTCGCCSAWVEHMAKSGFSVEARNLDQEALWALKARSGIRSELASCHTAFVNGYFVEGHVPAADVERLLAERPAALGLTVPGMPIGSPGMEMGDQREPYDSLLVLQDGTTRIFQSHS